MQPTTGGLGSVPPSGWSPGPLGWVAPRDRTQAQADAHARAMTRRPRFGLPRTTVPKGTKLILTDLWRDPLIVADIGQEFTGFHQLTGSCVGVSDGNAEATLSFVQRKLAVNPTKALVPWWPFAYGRTRLAEGDSGQGEGAVDSVMGECNRTEGTFDYRQPGLPSFKTDDGWYLTEQLEMQWSDGSRIAKSWIDLAKPNVVGSVVTLNSSDDIRDAVLNGYPVLDGCDNYVGSGSIKGSGANAYVVGKYDGRGGHSTCIFGYYEHPNDGPLFLYSNQWPTSTYPRDPAGAGRCCVWIPLSEMDKLFHTGGSGGETMLLSHLSYLAAQAAVLDWSTV